MPSRSRQSNSRTPTATAGTPSTATTAEDTPTGGSTEIPVNARDDEPTPEQYETAREALVERYRARVEELADAAPKGIYGKLALITGLVGQVRKSGENTFHHYKYAKESDLVEAIRPLLAEAGIWVHWTLHQDPDKGIVAHQRLSQTQKDRNRNIVGEADTLTVVTALFKFVMELADGKIVETEPQLMMGYGDDNSDKGLYKALTGMEKYFLFKSFLVSTGDDPEADNRADERAAARGASTSVSVRPSSRARQQPAAGGRQQQQTKPQTQSLRELLVALGITTATDTIALIERMTGDKIEVTAREDGAPDPGGSLAKYLGALDGQKMGKLIHDIREVVGSQPKEGGDAEAGDDQAPEEPAANAEQEDLALNESPY